MANRDFRITQGLLVGDSDLHFSLVGNTSLKLKNNATISIGDNAVVKAGDNVALLANDAGYLVPSDISGLRSDIDSESAAVQSAKSDLASFKTATIGKLDSDSTKIQSIGTQVEVIHTRLDSDHDLMKAKIASGLLNLADSELLTFQLDQKVAALIGRLDSDSIVQQTIRTQVFPRLDSDEAKLQTIRTNLQAEITATNTEVSAIVGRLDSDEGKLQSLNTAIGTETSTRASAVTALIARLDSDEIKIQQMNSLIGGELLAGVRGDLDSDSAAIQAVKSDLEAFKTDVKGRLDSDDGAIQAAASAGAAAAAGAQNRADAAHVRLDSDSLRLSELQIVVDAIRNDNDSEEAARSTFNEGITIGVNAANVNGMAVINPHQLTTTATTQVDIYTQTASGLKGLKLIVTAADGSSGERHVTELLATHDGTNVAFVEYGTVFTGSSALAAYDIDINGGNIRVRTTPASTNSTAFTVLESYTV
tara:strand:+ start:2795 stop:4225 length:1431 start_codon:yes stop_codon:yes gene_type:complete